MKYFPSLFLKTSLANLSPQLPACVDAVFPLLVLGALWQEAL